ncbi:MAG: prepilin-type N-terminal cleavage/methylation domain-containing protein [Patescibacteria group bacterium]
MEARSTKHEARNGYTLIELVVAVGLFALVMTLASGAYLLMIDLNRQAQGIATGVDNLSFALETMTRSIRTGTAYRCGTLGSEGDCPGGANSFSFTDASGADITYAHGFQADEVTGAIVKNGTIILTDPSVSVSSLMFYVSGTATVASADFAQPYVTIIISGTVSSGPRKTPQVFTVETGATMRGIDLNIASAPSEDIPTPTCTLSADSAFVLPGGLPKLSWTTRFSDSISIDQGIGPVSPAFYGSEDATTPLATTTTYTATATNSAGGSATCSATVSVSGVGSCSATHFGCISGTSANNVEDTNVWTWTCTGANGGTTVSCSEEKPTNLSGYAWSPLIGWISFSGPNYGVLENKTTGALYGYAWSSRIGWISFNASDGTHTAPRVDFTTGNISGWARACAAFADKTTCSEPLDSKSGGWDGWIALSGIAQDGSRYGITQSSTCEWTGFAWGSTGIGAISVRGTAADYSTYGVTGDDPAACAPH